MFDVKPCERCGAQGGKAFEDYHGTRVWYAVWNCGSELKDGKFSQSWPCRITELENELHLAHSVGVSVMAQGPCPGGCHRQTQGARYCLTCLQKKTVAEYNHDHRTIVPLEATQEQMTHSQGCAGWGNYNSEHLCTCDVLLPQHLFAIADLFKTSNWQSQANAVRDAGILIEQLTALIKGHIRACLNDGDAEIPYHCIGTVLRSIEKQFDAGIDAMAKVLHK